MNRSEQAYGILEGHVLQLFDTGNELFDNSTEPYVRLERFHDLVHGEPREPLAQESPFQARTNLIEFAHGCYTPREEC
jgi:hypothetical protein